MSQYARYPVESVFVTNFPTEMIVNQGTSPWVVSGTVAATQSGVWSVDRTWTLASGTDSVAAVQSGTWNINNISGTISLPTGAATSANQGTQITQLTAIYDRQSDGTQRAKAAGLAKGQLIRNDYSTTNVTTAAYVQLVASTSNDINRLHIFDSSGQDLVLATGAAASEVDQIQISPGGWDAPVDLFIPSGSRISVKAVSATASAGVLIITGLK